MELEIWLETELNQVNVKVAKRVKNEFATGSDDIPDCVVKQCINYIKNPLTSIHHSSLEYGIFPEQLKIAKVILVHKKGNTRDINSYRPIALLSVFSKVLEKLVYNRIIALCASSLLLLFVLGPKIGSCSLELEIKVRNLTSVHRCVKLCL
jgi:hypothetical protein